MGLLSRQNDYDILSLMLHFLIVHRYLALFLYVFIEEAGIPLPVPGDVSILVVSSLENVNYFGVAFFVITATLFGSSILYFISYKFGRPFLDKLGSKIKVTPERTQRIQKWMEKYGGPAIVIGRLTPGLRTVTSIAAGIFRMPFKTFFIFTGIAAWIWATIYYIVGKVFGHNYKNIIKIFPHQFPINIFTITLFLVAIFILLRRKQLREDLIKPIEAVSYLKKRPVILAIIILLALIILLAAIF